MKENNFMILFVLFWGILIGAAVYDTVSSLKYKPDASRKDKIESVYDSQFTSFEWKGHKYLRYSGYDTHYNTHVFNALLHDPDCTCWTNRLGTRR